MFDIIRKLNELKSYANSEKPLDKMIIAINEGQAEIKLRVFNSETGTKDVDGATLGTYSDNKLPLFFFEDKARRKVNLDKKKYKHGISYKDWRSLNGLQSKVVDLEFSGDLRRSISTVKINTTTIAVEIRDNENIKKANYLENMFSSSIFEASEKEKNEIMENIRLYISNDIKSILRNE